MTGVGADEFGANRIDMRRDEDDFFDGRGGLQGQHSSKEKEERRGKFQASL